MTIRMFSECRFCHREVRATDQTFPEPEWRHLDGFIFCDESESGATAGRVATPTPAAAQRLPGPEKRTWFEARTLDGELMANRAFNEFGVGAGRLMTLIDGHPLTPADWLVRMEVQFAQPLTLTLRDA
jgi:hypothetical protein